MGMIRKGLEHIGGRFWRCVKCDQVVEAQCECCEPPRCNCHQQKG